jgi:hypothetical protein
VEHASQRRLRRQVQALALIAATLAIFCVVLAMAWSREQRAAECWQAAFEDDEHPAEGRCA